MDKETNAVRAFRRVLRLTARALTAGVRDGSSCCGITTSQCHVLLEADQAGFTTVADLRNELYMDKGALSRTIDGLVNIGLMERREHAPDRRQQEVELSSQGKAFVADIHHASDSHYTAVFDSLPRTIRSRIVEDLEALAHVIRETQIQERECYSLEPAND